MTERLAPNKIAVAFVERRCCDPTVSLPGVTFDRVHVRPEYFQWLVHRFRFLEVFAPGHNLFSGFRICDDDLVLCRPDDNEGVSQSVVKGVLVSEWPTQRSVVDEIAETEWNVFQQRHEPLQGQHPHWI